MAYDILIKSGTVLDGISGNPFFADIGIKDDKIAGIGEIKEGSAKMTINAYGKYVTPGFIDITNHSDTHLTIFKYPNLESMVMQGVTTIIGGNCGSSLAPLGSNEAINSIRKWADPSQINVDWTNVEEFLNALEKFKLGVNFGTFLGYGTLRRGVLGNQSRILNFEEREKLKFLLSEGIKQGGFGLSLGLAYGHERVSTTEEIIEIGRALRGTGTVIKIHLRSEGKEIIASLNEAIRISRETGVPIQISHFKIIGKKAWPSIKKVLALVETAKSSGANIDFDVSPYNTTGSLLYLLIPAWARQGGFTELFKRMDDPTERAKIIEYLKTYTFHFDKVMVISAKLNWIVGKTLAEISASTNMGPEETLLEIIRANEGRVTIIGRTVSAKNTEMAIRDKNSFIASDGIGFSQEALNTGNLVHPRCFGTFPHFWHLFVDDLKILSPVEAIQKITSLPAKKIGISGRGIIKRGNFADLVVFDPKLIKDRATYRNPFKYPSGIEWVIINGVISVEQGRCLGVRAGRILRKS